MTTYKCDECDQPATLFFRAKRSAKIRYACSGTHAVTHQGGKWQGMAVLGGALHASALAEATITKSLGLAKKED